MQEQSDSYYPISLKEILKKVEKKNNYRKARSLSKNSYNFFKSNGLSNIKTEINKFDEEITIVNGDIPIMYLTKLIKVYI